MQIKASEIKQGDVFGDWKALDNAEPVKWFSGKRTVVKAQHNHDGAWEYRYFLANDTVNIMAGPSVEDQAAKLLRDGTRDDLREFLSEQG